MRYIMIFNCVKSEKEEHVDDSDENRKLQCCQTNGGKDSPCWTVMRKREEDEWKGIGGGGGGGGEKGLQVGWHLKQ